MKKIFYAVLFVLLLAGLFGCKSNNNVSSEADMSNGKLERSEERRVGKEC